MRKLFVLGGIFFCLFGMAAVDSPAADFPTKPIECVVGGQIETGWVYLDAF